MNYWLLKTEPEDFSYADLVANDQETWNGVRNRQAQSNIRKMAPGELAFIYHTGKVKAVVGVAEIKSVPFPDPTDQAFHAVKVSARYPLPRAVTLKEIKEAPQFAGWALVRQPRLSVMPVSLTHWQGVLDLAQTNNDSEV